MSFFAASTPFVGASGAGASISEAPGFGRLRRNDRAGPGGGGARRVPVEVRVAEGGHQAFPAHRSHSRGSAMSTNITDEHRRAFQALTSGNYDKGRGGTDFRPGFAWLEAESKLHRPLAAELRNRPAARRPHFRAFRHHAIRADSLRRVMKIEFPGDGGLCIEASSTVTGTVNCTRDGVGNLNSISLLSAAPDTHSVTAVRPAARRSGAVRGGRSGRGGVEPSGPVPSWPSRAPTEAIPSYSPRSPRPRSWSSTTSASPSSVPRTAATCSRLPKTAMASAPL